MSAAKHRQKKQKGHAVTATARRPGAVAALQLLETCNGHFFAGPEAVGIQMVSPSLSESNVRLSARQSLNPAFAHSSNLILRAVTSPLARRKLTNTQHFIRHTSRQISAYTLGAMPRLNPKSPVPSDIEIAQEAVPVPIVQIAEQLGVQSNELEQYGHMKAKVSSNLIWSTGQKAYGYTPYPRTQIIHLVLQVNLDVLKRLKDAPLGKYGQFCNSGHAHSS